MCHLQDGIHGEKSRLENNYGENNSEKHWEIYEIFRKIIKHDLALGRTPGPRYMALSGRTPHKVQERVETTSSSSESENDDD